MVYKYLTKIANISARIIAELKSSSKAKQTKMERTMSKLHLKENRRVWTGYLFPFYLNG